MVGIFLLYMLVLYLTCRGKRLIAMQVLGLSMILCIFVFYHHVTDILQINW